MNHIKSIGEYWKVHKWYNVGLIEMSKLSQQIVDLSNERDATSKNDRKPLSDEIVKLTHQKARIEGKTIQRHEILTEYAKAFGGL